MADHNHGGSNEQDHVNTDVTDGEITLDFVFSVSNAGQSLTATPTVDGKYDPGNLIEIDRAIRHSKHVVFHLVKKARECRNLIEDKKHFEVVLSTKGPSRARAYIKPKDAAGIHLELSDAVLLKAALAMQGK